MVSFGSLIRVFQEARARVDFDMSPERAIEFFRAKGLRTTFSYQEMLGDDHKRAFTVAKMLDVDMLRDVRSAVDRAITQGISLQTFREGLEPYLISRGWWGRQPVLDPLTGLVVDAQLGSAWRLETIFRTNLQTGYAVGSWETIKRTESALPLLQYQAVDDDRTRPEHAAWDGLVIPASDPFWDSHFPPNGFNCRCTTIQMDQETMEEFTGKTEPDTPPEPEYYEWRNPRTGRVHQVEEGFDPGWDNNPGVDPGKQLVDLMKEKLEAMPGDFAQVAGDSWLAGTAQAAQEAAKIAEAPKQEYLWYEDDEATLDQIKAAGGARLDELLGQKVNSSRYDPDTTIGQVIDDPETGELFLEMEVADTFRGELRKALGAARSMTLVPFKVANKSGAGKQVADRVSARFPDDWCEKVNRHSKPLRVSVVKTRGHYNHFSYSKSLGSYRRVATDHSSTAEHEFAHAVQHVLWVLDDYFQQEHRVRTAGEPLQQIYSWTKQERGRRDKYVNKYQGKEYAGPHGVPVGNALEVMTMALQPLLGDDPYANEHLGKMLRNDPDMLRLALGLLFHWRPST